MTTSVQQNSLTGIGKEFVDIKGADRNCKIRSRQGHDQQKRNERQT